MHVNLLNVFLPVGYALYFVISVIDIGIGLLTERYSAVFVNDTTNIDERSSSHFGCAQWPLCYNDLIGLLIH